MEKINIIIEEKNKILIIGGLIVILTIIISFQIVRLRIRQIQYVRSKITEEAKRIVLRKDIAKLDGLLSGYSKYFYKGGDELALRDTIYMLAREAKADIVSMQPLEPARIGNFSKISFKIDLNCSYSQMSNFIARIESFPEFISVDNLALDSEKGKGLRGGITEGPQQAAPDKKETIALASLVISAYSLR